MRILLDAARSYVLRTAWEYSHAPQFDPRLSWGVRVHAAEAATEVTQKALFLFGGRGIMASFPAEKLVRDALTMTHGNGTTALMTLRVGQHEAERRLAARTARGQAELAAQPTG
jgi:butyryl-CoA dehydrogenase